MKRFRLQAQLFKALASKALALKALALKSSPRVLALTLPAILAGCGTLNTAPKSNADIGRQLAGNGSYCSSVPRVYSGVAYDLCLLNAEERYLTSNTFLQYGILADLLVLSPVADTVLLPVTIMQQAKVGSAPVN
ncbi:YceK/YidQ family lipoprotein [Parahaliea mediterranea]|uniref:YceK/YidQ family lipoprotein n=1 Tax=Parahaliea mediterranea TaxID=651086 RepID=UPI00130018C3|nr:YceK/YidQ family lipoprotein [Parahaliea mediterranea]